MKVITPQFDELVELNGAELDQYLADERLALKKCQLPNVGVAFSVEMLQTVDDVIAGSVASVTPQDFGQLVNDVETAIRENELVAFAPRQRAMRHFHDTAGFCKAMSGVSQQIQVGEVIVPPGLYGDRHMVVWKRRSFGEQVEVGAATNDVTEGER